MKWIRLVLNENLKNKLSNYALKNGTTMTLIVKNLIDNFDLNKEIENEIIEEDKNKVSIAFKITEEQDLKIINAANALNIKKHELLRKIIMKVLQDTSCEKIEKNGTEISIRLLKSDFETFTKKVKDNGFTKNEIMRFFLSSDFDFNKLKYNTSRANFGSKISFLLYQDQIDKIDQNIKYFNNSRADLLRLIIQHLNKDTTNFKFLNI